MAKCNPTWFGFRVGIGAMVVGIGMLLDLTRKLLWSIDEATTLKDGWFLACHFSDWCSSLYEKIVLVLIRMFVLSEAKGSSLVKIYSSAKNVF